MVLKNDNRTTKESFRYLLLRQFFGKGSTLNCICAAVSVEAPKPTSTVRQRKENPWMYRNGTEQRPTAATIVQWHDTPVARHFVSIKDLAWCIDFCKQLEINLPRPVSLDTYNMAAIGARLRIHVTLFKVYAACAVIIASQFWGDGNIQVELDPRSTLRRCWAPESLVERRYNR